MFYRFLKEFLRIMLMEPYKMGRLRLSPGFLGALCYGMAGLFLSLAVWPDDLIPVLLCVPSIMAAAFVVCKWKAYRLFLFRNTAEYRGSFCEYVDAHRIMGWADPRYFGAVVGVFWGVLVLPGLLQDLRLALAAPIFAAAGFALIAHVGLRSHFYLKRWNDLLNS